MTAYVDASVLLRIVLGQPNSLSEWPQIEHGVSSSLLVVESLRTLDRLRLRATFSDAQLASFRSAALEVISSFEVVELTAPVLERAAQPMPVQLGTLDAIHLATALAWKQAKAAELVMATHDGALALAARAYGLTVMGSTV